MQLEYLHIKYMKSNVELSSPVVILTQGVCSAITQLTCPVTKLQEGGIDKGNCGEI